MKSLFTAFEPTKKPLLARLSAARTTPSEHVIPIVVVIGVFPGDPMAGRGHIDSKARNPVTASWSGARTGGTIEKQVKLRKSYAKNMETILNLKFRRGGAGLLH